VGLFISVLLAWTVAWHSQAVARTLYDLLQWP
jgi:hypothetical protein